MGRYLEICYFCKVYTSSRSHTNPFLRRQVQPSSDVAVLRTVQSVPKLGDVKAKALLERFKCKFYIAICSVHSNDQ